MARGYSLRQDIRTGLQTRVDPQLVLVSKLMELSQVELESKIERELDENPALERLDDTPTGVTSQEVLHKLGHDDRESRNRDYEAAKSAPEDAVDPMDFARAQISLAEHLIGQFRSLDPVLETLIYSLDERGYLSVSLEEVALTCQVSLEVVEAALGQLQACDPPGIAATSVPDCLLRQIKDLQGPEADLARRMLTDCLDDFLSRSVRTLSRRLKATPQLVEKAIQLILSLDPSPASEFQAETAEYRAARQRPVPELVIDRTEQGWTVTVPGSDSKDFRVNRSYEREWQRTGSTRREEGSRAHLSYYLTRAKRFLEAMRQRQKTLQKIGQTLIEEQSGFLLTGDYQFLNDFTQARFAKAAELHESTISRATSGKFLQIPSGELVPFEIFFDGSLRIKKMIQEILSCENPSAPMTDERIRQMLAEKGVQIARRTVHKYREEFNLLSSRLRRSA